MPRLVWNVIEKIMTAIANRDKAAAILAEQQHIATWKEAQRPL